MNVSLEHANVFRITWRQSMVDLKDVSVGVEIETINATRHTVAQAIQSVVGGEVVHIGTPSCYG